MPSTDLFEPASAVRTPQDHHPNRRLPAWLLPAALVLALCGMFAFVLRDRLLPAQQVAVAPAILIAGIESTAAPAPVSEGAQASASEAALDYSAEMLFQAAGWFEPDPLPIRATALVDGVVAEVHVLEGQTVTRGQLLAELVADDTRLSLSLAERALEEVIAEHHMHLAQIPAVKAEAESVLDQIIAAEARLAELADRNARLQRLTEGTISEQERTSARLAVEAQTALIASLKSDHAAVAARLEAIETQSTVFDARIAAAKVAVEEKQLAHARTSIVSPVDGVVLELKAAPGQKKMLAMDELDSATIAVLFETGKLQARVDVPLADARGLLPGQPAIITSDFLPNTEFKGVVTRIVGSADLQRNTLQAKVRVIDPDPRLRPEMLCRVKFLPSAQHSRQSSDSAPAPAGAGQSSTRAVMAPSKALLDRTGNVAAAWVVSADGTHAERRSLTLGMLQQDGYVAVDNGILPGELLILPPHTGLAEGRRIAPATANDSPSP